MKHALALPMMLAVYIGCGSVPDVVFVREGDGGGSGSGSDGGGDGGGDGGPVNDSGSTPDTGAPTCGGREFPPGSTCCSDVLCFGSCGGGKCKQDCQSKGCAAPQVCCRIQTGSNPNDTIMSCVATAADCQ